LELFWYKKEFNSENDKNISIIYSISNWLNAVVILKFNISANCRISSFLIWLLVGRENLESDEIGNDEIKDDKENIGIINCEKFFLNYADRCAVSIYFANLIIDKAAIEIANTY
jgi:hypothetical protein